MRVITNPAPRSYTGICFVFKPMPRRAAERVVAPDAPREVALVPGC